MADIEELQLQFQNEKHDVKYFRDLLEYWNAYMFSIIDEIYAGIGVNLGLPEQQAYKLAKEKPGDLKKAGFFKGIFDKFKRIFTYKIPKFRYKKKLYKSDKPLTSKEWDKFDNYLNNYWKEYANKITGDIVIKTHMLGKETTNFRKKDKSYQNKSLYQINFDQYDGNMPDNIAEAYRKYDFNNTEKKFINKSMSEIAMYVSRTGNDVKDAIRQVIQAGIDDGKGPVEVASDLYWKIEKGDKFLNKYTAEEMRYNWNRIAATEMSSIYENGILAEYENQAMESLKDSSKAIYMVRHGGTCEFCRGADGTLMRMIPAEIADPSTNKLSDIGIKDPNTDLYTYIGQNNIGRKQKNWFKTAVPAHPYNQATRLPINIKDEWYNPKSGKVEKRQEKKKYVPKQKDFNYRSEEEKKERKPHYISSTKVQMNGNLYEAVSKDEYNQKLEEHRKNPSLPIPVRKDSPGYDRIFGEAEKYGA